MHVFRTREFLHDYFQTPARLTAFLIAWGVPAPAMGTVAKWFQRETIPSEWLPVILAFLEMDMGAPVSLQPYLGRAP